MKKSSVYEEHYVRCVSLAQILCSAKDKIRLLCMTGKVNYADNLRKSILKLRHPGLTENCMLEMFNELTYDIILTAKINTGNKA